MSQNAGSKACCQVALSIPNGERSYMNVVRPDTRIAGEDMDGIDIVRQAVTCFSIGARGGATEFIMFCY